MAQSCPCGCSRNLGLLKRRMAQHALDLGVAFPILERMQQQEASFPAEFRNVARNLLTKGRSMFGAMIRTAHGEDGWPVPSVGEMRDWQRGTNHAVGAVNLAEPEFIAAYINRIRPQQGALVRSMVSWSDSHAPRR